MRMHSADYDVMLRRLFVRPSVRHTRILCRKGKTCHQLVHIRLATTIHHTSFFSVPSLIAIFRRGSLPPNQGVDSSGLKRP